MNYSVLMSVYKNEKVEYFIQAVDSLLNQTIAPEQIVLVRDGGVYKELQNTIDEYISKYPNVFTYLPLEQNGGLGNALRYGLTHCRNEWVGRMDTDDIFRNGNVKKNNGESRNKSAYDCFLKAANQGFAQSMYECGRTLAIARGNTQEPKQ